MIWTRACRPNSRSALSSGWAGMSNDATRSRSSAIALRTSPKDAMRSVVTASTRQTRALIERPLTCPHAPRLGIISCAPVLVSSPLRQRHGVAQSDVSSTTSSTRKRESDQLNRGLVKYVERSWYATNQVFETPCRRQSRGCHRPPLRCHSAYWTATRETILLCATKPRRFVQLMAGPYLLNIPTVLGAADSLHGARLLPPPRHDFRRCRLCPTSGEFPSRSLAQCHSAGTVRAP